MRSETVAVGLSGGVDSAVAACLLKRQGYRVIGVTVQTWQPEGENPEYGRETEDAKTVARQLDIPCHVIDFRKEFRREVIHYFVEEYRRGRTPNPCIVCNRYVKWESLLQKSRTLGADYIATGHYAKISRLENGRYTISNARSGQKDQTYALCRLTQEQLAHTLFPIGEYEKEEIRRIAVEEGLAVAGKSDSMEICFVPDGDYAAFIQREAGIKEKPGDFVDLQGNILGRHRGISHYTVGQRKGLGIAFGEPRFVVAIRPERNEVVLGQSRDVFTDRVCAEDLNFMAVDSLEPGRRVLAKIRYSHAAANATVEECSRDRLSLLFDEPVRAVTPGQAVVLYEQENILAAGTIIASPRPV